MTFDIQNGILKGVRDCDAHVVIPDSVKALAPVSFREAPLRSVIIPHSVTSIGFSAFAECLSLESIVIPDSVTEIGETAFRACPALKSVRLSPSHFHLTCRAWVCPDIELTARVPAMEDALEYTKTVVCIAPIGDIPEEYRLKACLGFALHAQEYSEEMRPSYFDYIRTHAADMILSAFDYPALLRLMCCEGLIDSQHFDMLLDESLRRGQNELTALLLDYKRTHLCGESDELMLN